MPKLRSKARSKMIPETPLHEHPLPHPSTDDMQTRFVEYYELPQGRSHKQPWQPVVISLGIVATIFTIIWSIL